MQPAVESNSWIHTPGCMVPRPLPELRSWRGEGRPGPRLLLGRAVWQLVRLGGGKKRSPVEHSDSLRAPGFLQEGPGTKATTA